MQTVTSTIFDDVRHPVGEPPGQLPRAAGDLVAVGGPSVAGGSGWKDRRRKTRRTACG